MYLFNQMVAEWIPSSTIWLNKFSAENLALAGFPLTNALIENMPSRY